MLLIDGKLVRTRTSAIVGGFDDEKVHAEENRDEDQCGDTKSCLKGDVLNDSTGDCLTKIGLVCGCVGRGGDEITREAHQRPACSPRLRS